jgi:hypothetical protein
MSRDTGGGLVLPSPKTSGFIRLDLDQAKSAWAGSQHEPDVKEGSRNLVLTEK